MEDEQTNERSGSSHATATGAPNAFRDFEDCFLDLLWDFKKVDPPRSVAELHLSEQAVRRLKERFRSLPVDPRPWLWDVTATERQGGVRCAPAEVFGGLLLVLAAELCREEGTEGAIWPYVRSCLPERFTPELFPGGQPSTEVKQAIARAARLLELRHAIGWCDSLEYFNTVKLQFGFTIRGARRKLAYWLVGIGEPVVVRALRGEDPEHPEAESDSFKLLWLALRDFRRGHLREEDTRRALERSPWVRSHWVSELLKQARAHLERLGTGDEPREDRAASDTQANLPAQVFLEWSEAGPRLNLELVEDAVEDEVAGWSTDKIQFVVSGQTLVTWIRQTGGWRGERTLPLSNWKSPTLTVKSTEGPQAVVFQLADSGLSEDILVFDLAAGGRMLGQWERMDRVREYALMCDDALEVKGSESEVIGQARQHGRKLYRLGAGWSETLRLEFGGLVYWEPSIREGRGTDKLELDMSNLGDRPARLGTSSPLVVRGVPEEALEVAVFVDANRKKMGRFGTNWRTCDSVRLDPPFLLGQQRIRVQIRTETSDRLWKPMLRWNTLGLAVLDRKGSDEEQAPKWTCVEPEEDLDRAGGHHLARLFIPFESGLLRLLEGPRVVAGGSRRLALRLLAGWGEPLRAEDGESQNLVRSVVDRGVVQRFYGRLLGCGCFQVILKNSIEPSPQHSIVLWARGENLQRVQIRAESGRPSNVREGRWILEPYDEPWAWAIAYGGTRVGSDWRVDALRQALGRVPTLRTFGLLRWFKVPVLGPHLVSEFRRAVALRPVEFLKAWFCDGELPSGLRHNEAPEELLPVIRSVLWNAHLASDGDATEILGLFAKRVPAGDAEHARTAAVRYLAELCPPLAWRVVPRVKKGSRLGKRALRETLGLNGDASGDEIESALKTQCRLCARGSGMTEEHLRALANDFLRRLEQRVPMEDRQEFALKRLAETTDGSRWLAAVILRAVASP